MSTTPAQAFIDSLEGLSTEPLRRAAQIALAAVDRVLSEGDEDDAPLVAAYEALQAALA